MYYCFFCGNEVDVSDRIKHTETCFNCKSDLHCCMNCRHYDPGRKYQCRETINNPIYDKVSGNFCDMFLYLEGPPRKHDMKIRSDNAKKEADNLFKPREEEVSVEEKKLSEEAKKQKDEKPQKHKEMAESLFKKK